MYLSCLWYWNTTTRIHVKARTSLKPGDTMDDDHALLSEQGECFLYFAHFNGYKKGKYLNIMCGPDVDNNQVWMYDRNHPINSNSPVLSLDNFGVLKIETNTRKPIIIYSSPQPINNTEATMLNTGNFVLEQIHPNGTKSLLWQSFDYPVDTLMPTMKLGVNRKTGHNWSLVSALTGSVSTSGKFNLEWEPKQGELNIKKHGKVYWKSGKLGRNGLFENIPANVQQMYKYIIVSNKDEDSFAFKIKDRNNNKFPGWILFPTGRLSSNNGDIGNADMCYGYNSDGGCQKWEGIPTCRDQGEVFQKQSGSPSFDNVTLEENALYGYNDCKENCWRNCNCTGFRNLYENGTGCIFYSSNSTKDVNFGDDGNYHFLVKPIKVARHGT
ncbi:hypothetical protein TSUD_368340 [Trifolium subterraneum]|uniref:Bulb-type lectin domain-containing protein n=1 Tax=Trifolium subterraneum TaxID=3900 RepID=A0A2Z6M4K0_TRISU|nr:hypothetical protein TSUD_368340 [Trifolium subterraneum]